MDTLDPVSVEARKCLYDLCISPVLDSQNPQCLFCQYHTEMAHWWVWMATHVQIQQKPPPLVVPGLKLPKRLK